MKRKAGRRGEKKLRTECKVRTEHKEIPTSRDQPAFCEFEHFPPRAHQYLGPVKADFTRKNASLRVIIIVKYA